MDLATVSIGSAIRVVSTLEAQIWQAAHPSLVTVEYFDAEAAK